MLYIRNKKNITFLWRRLGFYGLSGKNIRFFIGVTGGFWGAGGARVWLDAIGNAGVRDDAGVRAAGAGVAAVGWDQASPRS